MVGPWGLEPHTSCSTRGISSGAAISPWGDRYVAMPVELLAMMAIPLLLRHRAALKTVVWRTAWGIAAAGIVAQLTSVVFWHPLEVYQVMIMGHPTFVVGLRFKNIIADILGKYEQ
jgi:hypothetical protein